MDQSSQRSAPLDVAATGPDHRKRPRRRGEALHHAIFAATLDELAETGYATLTMDRIAERARTSKASLYRRWPTRAELVVAAFLHARPAPAPAPDTGDLRDDLFTLLRHAATQLAGPTGQVARGVIADALRHPELLTVLRDRVMNTRHEVVRDVLRRAIARGEADPTALTPHIAGLGPTLLSHHFLLHGAPIPDQVITDILDDVVLPLIRVRPEQP